MTSNLRTKAKEVTKATSVKIVSTCPKDNSCDDKNDSKDCSVESWLKALKNNFFDNLVVTAAQVGGLESLLRKTTKGGDWKGTVIDLFEQVLSRIPGITTYTILEADTPQEAKELVLSGQAVLDLTPTALTTLLPTNLSYVPIADNEVDTWNVIWAQSPENLEPLRCDPNSIAARFSSTEYAGLSFLRRLEKYIYEQNALPFVVLVNSDAQKEYILRNLPPSDQLVYAIELIHFDYVPIATSPSDVDEILSSDDVFDQCDAVYFGSYLPLDCATRTETTTVIGELDASNLSLLRVNLTEETQVRGYGWAIAPWAYHWQIWLQFAIDSVVKAGKYPKQESKKKHDDDDEDEFASCLKLSAPPPLYGFCIRSLPLVNVGERLLESPKCITPHPVTQNGSECGNIKW